MRTVPSSARLNKVTASEMLHQFLMSRSHDCCLQRGPLFPIFPVSFWWLFDTWPGLEAILLDSLAIVKFRELWHDCLEKYGFLLIVILGSRYFRWCWKTPFPLSSMSEPYRLYSVFFTVLVRTRPSALISSQGDLICFLIQYDLYVRRERLSMLDSGSWGGGGRDRIVVMLELRTRIFRLSVVLVSRLSVYTHQVHFLCGCCCTSRL